MEADKNTVINLLRELLIHDKLIMAELVIETGWSFPRLRSRAKTICKSLNGSLCKLERGVYYFEPNNTNNMKD